MSCASMQYTNTMKTLLVYASKYSSTKTCAEHIAAALPGVTDVQPAESAPSPQDYDYIVLGTAIYGGTSLPAMQSYCKKYTDELLQQPLHLFICCINPKPSIINKQIQTAFSPTLHQHATQAVNFGGAIDMNQLTIAEKAMMRLLGYTDSKSMINHEAISQFSAAVSHTSTDSHSL